jgi:hypothetical protein
VGVGGYGGGGTSSGLSYQNDATAPGGGGAGYGGTSATHRGGYGLSGLVALRYSAGRRAAASVTGSPVITLSAGFRVYTWTGSSGSITF